MIRILHVIDSLDLGGAQTALLNLVKYADTSKFTHEVAAMHGDGMFAQAFRALGVQVHSLSAHRWPPGYLANLPRVLRRERYDLVQFHLFASNWIAKPLAALCGVRCLYHHDQCNDAFRTESRAAIFIDSLTNRLSTRILTVSRSVEDFNLRVEEIPREKVTFLPNSVDLAEFRVPTLEDRLVARRRFGLPEDAFIIGGVGRLTPQKNFGLLIDASAPLVTNGRTMLALFGSGPEEEMLRRRARDGVRFMGTATDRTSIYHALDVMVLPSRFEGLPMTVLEAMASGVPVAASAVDGVREIATDGKHALLAPSEDVAAFRAVLERLCGEPDLRQSLSLAARRLVEETFDARKLAAELERWYLHDLARAR